MCPVKHRFINAAFRLVSKCNKLATDPYRSTSYHTTFGVATHLPQSSSQGTEHWLDLTDSAPALRLSAFHLCLLLPQRLPRLVFVPHPAMLARSAVPSAAPATPTLASARRAQRTPRRAWGAGGCWPWVAGFSALASQMRQGVWQN